MSSYRIVRRIVLKEARLSNRMIALYLGLNGIRIRQCWQEWMIPDIAQRQANIYRPNDNDWTWEQSDLQIVFQRPLLWTSNCDTSNHMRRWWTTQRRSLCSWSPLHRLSLICARPQNVSSSVVLVWRAISLTGAELISAMSPALKWVLMTNEHIPEDVKVGDGILPWLTSVIQLKKKL